MGESPLFQLTIQGYQEFIQNWSRMPWHISEQSDAGRSEATAATTPLAATNIPCWQQHLRPVTNPPNNGRRFPT